MSPMFASVLVSLTVLLAISPAADRMKAAKQFTGTGCPHRDNLRPHSDRIPTDKCDGLIVPIFYREWWPDDTGTFRPWPVAALSMRLPRKSPSRGSFVFQYIRQEV